MKGTTKKEGSSWYFVVDLGKGPDGKRIRKKKRGFKTKKEAEIALAKVINEVSTGTYIETSRVSYGEFLHSWLETNKNSLKRQTIDNYRQMIKCRITPALGSIPVQKLNAQTIQNFLNDLMDQNLSASYVKKILAVISASLEHAVRLDLISQNLAKKVVKPRITKKEMQVWSPEEISCFLKAAEGDRFYIAFYLAITTGMRKGEILGLRWRDIDFDNSCLNIHQTLSHDGKYFQNGGKTKASSRPNELPNEAVSLLKKHRSIILQEKLAKGNKYTDFDLVVCTPNGTPVHPSNLDKMWLAIQKKAGLKRIRFHDLRHSHATILLNAGVNIKVISERLGHSKTSMTLDTYSHVMPNMQKEAASTISKVLFDTKMG